MPLNYSKYEKVTMYNNLTDFMIIIRTILDTGCKLLFAGFGLKSNFKWNFEDTNLYMSFETFTVTLFPRLDNRVYEYKHKLLLHIKKPYKRLK
jgi:hypothetical protein